MRLYKIAIDTCVIVSSIRSNKGASYKILSNINKNLFKYGLSVPLYCEYEEQLKRLLQNNTINLKKRDIEIILSALVYYSHPVPIYYQIRPNLKDEDDNMVYECAVNYGADYIITFNDKDFTTGDLKPYNLRVISPQEFIKKVGEQ